MGGMRGEVMTVLSGYGSVRGGLSGKGMLFRGNFTWNLVEQTWNSRETIVVLACRICGTFVEHFVK